MRYFKHKVRNNIIGLEFGNPQEPNDYEEVLPEDFQTTVRTVSEETLYSIISDRISEKKELCKVSGVLVGDKWFHTTSDSKFQYLGLRDLSSKSETEELYILGNPVIWKTMDKSLVPMTKTLIDSIITKVMELDAICHYTAEQHKQGLLNSSDKANYDFSHGWPNGFIEEPLPPALPDEVVDEPLPSNPPVIAAYLDYVPTPTPEWMNYSE
jgi:hypothetical protein